MIGKTYNGKRPFRDDEKLNPNKCSLCGCEDAEDYAVSDDYVICSNCSEEMDVDDIMDLFGYEAVFDIIRTLSDRED